MTPEGPSQPKLFYDTNSMIFKPTELAIGQRTRFHQKSPAKGAVVPSQRTGA